MSDKSDNEHLKKRIADLEKVVTIQKDQLLQKEQELVRYREEVQRAHNTLERVIKQMGQELQSMTKLQRALSPTEIPSIPGFEFSTKFSPGSKSGGDYFDIFEHENRLKFGIILSSTSGHSMSALLLSVLIKISSKMEARRGLEPEQMMARLVQELTPQMSEKDLCHVFYGVVDRRDFSLKFSMIGNIDAFLEDAATHKIQALDSFYEKGLTKSFNLETKSMQIPLNPKDRLILATEGVRRAIANPQVAAASKDVDPNNLAPEKMESEVEGKGEEWGRKRLIESILGGSSRSVHDVRNNILFDVERFSNLVEPHRDQTVLVMEVKEKVIKLA